MSGAPYRIDLFRLTLTGAPNGLADVELPLVNVNARLRSGADSYLQATLPYTTDIANSVSARPDGDLRLDHIARSSDGSEVVTTVCTVALETIQPSRGVNSRSIVLVGHRQSTNSTPASHAIRSLSLQTGATVTAIMPGFDPLIRPADTVTTEGVTILVETVSVQAARSNIQTQLIGGAA